MIGDQAQRYKFNSSIITVTAIGADKRCCYKQSFTNIRVLEDEEELTEGVGWVEYVQGEGGDAGTLEEPLSVRLQQGYLVGQQQTAVCQVSQAEPLDSSSFQSKVCATSGLYNKCVTMKISFITLYLKKYSYIYKLLDTYILQDSKKL